MSATFTDTMTHGPAPLDLTVAGIDTIVTPEPATGLLMALPAAWLWRRRR